MDYLLLQIVYVMNNYMPDKRANFLRLAEKRVEKTIKNLRLIGNLSNRGNYAYDDEQVVQMFSALESEFKKARMKFHISGSSSETGFKFKA